jgi:hypothetical protein
VASKRKFYRTLVTVEVLSEEPYYPETLEQVAHDICEGDCSGDWTHEKSIEVDGLSMAKLLIAQGSDAGFFRLDDKGNDIDDDYLEELV